MKKLVITYLQELGIGLSFISSSHSRGTAEALKPRRSLTSQRNTETPTDRIASTGDRRSDGSDSPPTTGTTCTADRERKARTARTTRQAVRPANPRGRRERYRFELAPRASALRGAGPHAPYPNHPGTQSCSVHVVRTCDPWRTGTDCRYGEEARSPHRRRSLTCNQRRENGYDIADAMPRPVASSEAGISPGGIP